MSQLEEQCEVSYWKEDAPVTREALMQGVKVIFWQCILTPFLAQNVFIINNAYYVGTAL